jgi:demethylmacrocin O-methyltransferase
VRKKTLNVLEIGVGGYNDPGRGGESLRMWKAYFQNSKIFGIDIHDKKIWDETRVEIFQGSQNDEAFLRDVVRRSGGLDIIIDDGSHINRDVIKSFEILFPLMRSPGTYVVEDTQTSYWPGFGGSSLNLSGTEMVMGYFTELVHSLNYQEILQNSQRRPSYDGEISAMHFYHNLVFICKGNNAEGSNFSTQNPAHAREMLGETMSRELSSQSPELS